VTDHKSRLTIRDIVLHAGSWVDLKFFRIDRSSKSAVESPGILSLSVTFGIVDMFSGQIATESFGSNLKLGGSVSMGYRQWCIIPRSSQLTKETKNHDDVENSLQVSLG